MTVSLSQIRLQNVSDSLIRISIRQNHFIAGDLDTTERIFYSIPRSKKNLFYLFGEPGLGINEEILLLDSYDTIKVKFNDSILTTTRRKWLNKGITSPYCNSTVDKQIILKLSDINMTDADKYEPITKQQELFSEVTT